MVILSLLLSCETTTVIGTDRCSIEIENVNVDPPTDSDSTEESENSTNEDNGSSNDSQPSSENADSSGVEQVLTIRGYPFGEIWDTSVMINGVQGSVVARNEHASCAECSTCQLANLCGECNECILCADLCIDCINELTVKLPAEELLWHHSATNQLQVFTRLGHSDIFYFSLSDAHLQHAWKKSLKEVFFGEKTKERKEHQQ